MKKIIALFVLALTVKLATGQTQMTKVLDSFSWTYYLQQADDKLYLVSKLNGGEQYQVDTSTGALTVVAKVANGMYDDLNQDMTYLNNRMLITSKSPSKILSASTTQVDTFFKGWYADNYKIDTTVYFRKGDDGTLWATNMLSAPTRIDTTVVWSFAGAHCLYYLKNYAPGPYNYQLYKVVGYTKTLIESIPTTAGYNTYVTYGGEWNGDLYYFTSLQAMSDGWINIKKYASGTATFVDSIARGCYMQNNGSFNSGGAVVGYGKIYLSVNVLAPANNGSLWKYDIATGQKSIVVPTSANLGSTALNPNLQTPQHIFFGDIGGSGGNLYITDGTQAGTKLYIKGNKITFDNPLGFNFDYSDEGTLCGAYPVGSLNKDTAHGYQYYYGVDTGMVQLVMQPKETQLPLRDFCKIGSSVYFIGFKNNHNAIVIYKVNGCDKPTVMSLAEVPAQNGDLLVYPNPAKGTFTVSAPFINAKVSVRLYSLQGEAIGITTKVHNQQCEVTPLSVPASGIYYLQVSNGQEVYHKKVTLL